MRALDILTKKRDGHALTHDEIAFFIERYTANDIPDYQAAALLMAIYLRGMTREETLHLTQAMAASGDQLDLSDISDYIVDKHSSGGVGDKTSLVVLPLVSACGVPIAKMSGRGLGFSGGTLDKMDAINGFKTALSMEEFRALAKQNQLVLAGQSADLAPADGKLYALRDVTATVPCLPLIASSIMSKKLAAGANGIVLDVKLGIGAFMATLEDARALAQIMVEIGTDAGRDVIAMLSDMNQPLGNNVGNALEVLEAIETLQGGGPADFREHCLVLGAQMLLLAGQGKRWPTEADARETLTRALENGAGMDAFRKMVAAQGGDVAQIDDPARLPQARIIETLTVEQSGYLAQVAADQIAWGAFELGAGREKKTDQIDLAVGVKLHFKVGDYVQQGAPIITIYANDADKLAAALPRLRAALVFSEAAVPQLPLFYGRLDGYAKR
jgi:pyrimidine-nucleoside phosphorylase